MAKIIKLGLVLLAITAVTGLILGGVHTLTLEPIRAAKEKEKMEALKSTLPSATEFKQLAVTGDTSGLVKEVNEGRSGGAVVGYNITVAPKGYAGPVEFVAGVTTDGTLKGIKVLNHGETPGLGAKAALPPFDEQFADKKTARFSVTKTPPTSGSEIMAISGATITSAAVVSGVNAALDYWQTNFSGQGPAADDDVDAASSASPQP